MGEDPHKEETSHSIGWVKKALIFTIGFGIDLVYSDNLVPKPPAKITTFIFYNFFFDNKKFV